MIDLWQIQQKEKPLPTIGVDKYTFFAVLTDTSEGATYGDPYNLRVQSKLHRQTQAAVMFLTPITVRMKHQTTLKN
mgnify:CR=1 FL=1